MNKLRLSEGELAARIRSIMDAIRSPEHADDIIELRRILRKHVPFFFRSYFAAYLLKDLVESGRPGPRAKQGGEGKRDQARRGGESRGSDDRGDEERGRRDKEAKRQEPKRQEARPRQGGEQRPRQGGNAERVASEPRKQERQPPLPEGVEAATLFVSAGRKRHFYPRHVLELLEEGGTPREKVGEIRLFDNYMFVQIAADAADEAISRLDGLEFKGRKLAVNHARKRDEEPAPPGEADAPAPGARRDGESARDEEEASRPEEGDSIGDAADPDGASFDDDFSDDPGADEDPTLYDDSRDRDALNDDSEDGDPSTDDDET
jgi:hypothetical protein